MKDADSRTVASEGLSGEAEWVEWAMTTSALAPVQPELRQRRGGGGHAQADDRWGRGRSSEGAREAEVAGGRDRDC